MIDALRSYKAERVLRKALEESVPQLPRGGRARPGALSGTRWASDVGRRLRSAPLRGGGSQFVNSAPASGKAHVPSPRLFHCAGIRSHRTWDPLVPGRVRS